MKTLDEVIKALELCTSSEDCTGYECPYRQEGTCCDLVAVPKMQADALHYLKEYQKFRKALNLKVMGNEPLLEQLINVLRTVRE